MKCELIYIKANKIWDHQNQYHFTIEVPHCELAFSEN